MSGRKDQLYAEMVYGFAHLTQRGQVTVNMKMDMRYGFCISAGKVICVLRAWDCTLHCPRDSKVVS